MANQDMNVVKNQAIWTNWKTNWLGMMANRRMNRRKRDWRCARGRSSVSG